MRKVKKYLSPKVTEFLLISGLRYASPESLSLCIQIKKSKKLYSEIVPKTVDEYLSLIEKYPNQKEKDQIINPVWHIIMAFTKTKT